MFAKQSIDKTMFRIFLGYVCAWLTMFVVIACMGILYNDTSVTFKWVFMTLWWCVGTLVVVVTAWQKFTKVAILNGKIETHAIHKASAKVGQVIKKITAFNESKHPGIYKDLLGLCIDAVNSGLTIEQTNSILARHDTRIMFSFDFDLTKSAFIYNLHQVSESDDDEGVILATITVS